MSDEASLRALAISLSNSLNVDSNLVCAIVQVESRWNPCAVRFEPTYKYLENPEIWAVKIGFTVDTETVLQKISWGLLQVMGGVARQLQYQKPLTELCDPEDGLNLGILYLKSKIERYGSDEKSVIAAYNAGSAVVVDGVYRNQDYVDRVSEALSQLRGNN